jgi:hypothetical protein
VRKTFFKKWLFGAFFFAENSVFGFGKSFFVWFFGCFLWENIDFGIVLLVRKKQKKLYY